MCAMSRLLLAVLLSILLQSCLSYSGAKKELVKPGKDDFSINFLPPGECCMLTGNLKKEMESDIADCVRDLRRQFKKPSSSKSGQKQIKVCMEKKGWFAMEEILLRH